MQFVPFTTSPWFHPDMREHTVVERIGQVTCDSWPHTHTHTHGERERETKESGGRRRASRSNSNQELFSENEGPFFLLEQGCILSWCLSTPSSRLALVRGGRGKVVVVGDERGQQRLCSFGIRLRAGAKAKKRGGRVRISNEQALGRTSKLHCTTARSLTLTATPKYSAGKPYRRTLSTKLRITLRWVRTMYASEKFVLANRSNSVQSSFSDTLASSSSIRCLSATSSSHTKSRTWNLKREREREGRGRGVSLTATSRFPTHHPTHLLSRHFWLNSSFTFLNTVTLKSANSSSAANLLQGEEESG